MELQPIAPDVPFAAWLANPEAAAAAITQAVAQWEVLGIAGGLIVVAAVALKFLRNVPGWGPIAHTAGTWFLNQIAPDNRLKQAQAVQQYGQTVQTGFELLVQTIEQLPDGATLGDLKAKLGKKVQKIGPELFRVIDELKPQTGVPPQQP